MITGNIQGLYPRKGKHKIDLLRELTAECNTNIIALTESHLRQDIKDAEEHIQNIEMFRADRSEGTSGVGAVVYLRNCLQGEKKTIVLWFKWHC